MTRRTRRIWCATAIGVLMAAAIGRAHQGPPFPIVSDRVAGPYRISIWTDPDSTDDGSAAGRFWVTIQPVRHDVSLPSETRATISIAPAGRPSPALAARAEPTRPDATTQFAALVLDHEGRFRVRVDIAGPLGPAAVEADIDATYDLRPAPGLIVLYLVPFVLAGFLWLKLLLRRRRSRQLPT